jgi:hypothetical protein
MPDRIIDMAGPVGELCWLVCAYQNSTPGGQPLFFAVQRSWLRPLSSPDGCNNSRNIRCSVPRSAIAFAVKCIANQNRYGVGQRKALSAQRGLFETAGAQMTPNHALFYLTAARAQIKPWMIAGQMSSNSAAR